MLQEWWSVVEHQGVEDEVYVSGRTVVWCRGQAGSVKAAHIQGNIFTQCTG